MNAMTITTPSDRLAAAIERRANGLRPQLVTQLKFQAAELCARGAAEIHVLQVMGHLIDEIQVQAKGRVDAQA